jgi:hypothetical protein
VRALLPLTRPPEQEALDLVGPADENVRLISTTILRAARSALDVAQAVGSGAASLNAWDEAVSSGVSANLCDALARLPGTDPLESGDVSLRIGWTWAAPLAEASPLVVPVGSAPILAAAADYLRDQPEEHNIRVTGLVTKLHRETATGAGDITVRGHIENLDSGVRPLRLELDAQSYREAIAAHDVGASVQVTATVRRTPRALRVVQVVDFQILTPPPRAPDAQPQGAGSRRPRPGRR